MRVVFAEDAPPAAAVHEVIEASPIDLLPLDQFEDLRQVPHVVTCEGQSESHLLSRRDTVAYAAKGQVEGAGQAAEAVVGLPHTVNAHAHVRHARRADLLHLVAGDEGPVGRDHRPDPPFGGEGREAQHVPAHQRLPAREEEHGDAELGEVFDHRLRFRGRELVSVALVAGVRVAVDAAKVAAAAAVPDHDGLAVLGEAEEVGRQPAAVAAVANWVRRSGRPRIELTDPDHVGPPRSRLLPVRPKTSASRRGRLVQKAIILPGSDVGAGKRRPIFARTYLSPADPPLRPGSPAQARRCMSALGLSGGRGHDLPDLALHRLLAHAADAPFAEDALPFDEEVRGDADDAVLGGDTCRLVDADGEGRAGTLDVARYGAGGLTDAYRQHDEALTFMGLVDLLNVGGLGAAGRAPGGPEVDPDGPAAEIAEPDVLTVEGVEAEIRRLAFEAGSGTGRRCAEGDGLHAGGVRPVEEPDEANDHQADGDGGDDVAQGADAGAAERGAEEKLLVLLRDVRRLVAGPVGDGGSEQRELSSAGRSLFVDASHSCVAPRRTGCRSK